MEVHRGPWRFHGVLHGDSRTLHDHGDRSPWRRHGVSSRSPESLSMNLHWDPWTSMNICGGPMHLMETPWISMEIHRGLSKIRWRPSTVRNISRWLEHENHSIMTPSLAFSSSLLVWRSLCRNALAPVFSNSIPNPDPNANPIQNS